MAKKKSRTSRRPSARTSAHGKRARSAESRGGGRPGSKAARSGPSAKAAAIENMIFAHNFVIRACEGFPDDKLCYQNCPADNHPLWTLGHLATGYDWFAGLLDGKPSQLSEETQKLFGGAGKPQPDASVYPPLGEVRATCDAAWKRMLRAAQNTSEADLSAPPATPAGSFASDRLTVINRTAWHDGWHAGQVSTLRRSLGLPGLM
jgi:hypothetical protein